jgi:uncharacterized protein with NAD-binding domain and iron-sulfur cluster
MARPLRVAVVGGGCAALTAAFELSKPRTDGRGCEVTIYQMGHRLGGKGASGRGVCGRIEEHGLHLWMGYYENAFRLVREVYAELDRDPASCPIARWSDAFAPANLNAVADWSPSGRWLPWIVDFPPSRGLPGDGAPLEFSVPDYLSRLAALARTLIRTIEIERDRSAALETDPFPELAPDSITADVLLSTAGRLLKHGAAAAFRLLMEAVALLELALGRAPLLPQSPLAGVVEALAHTLRQRFESLIAQDDEVRRLWEVLDLVLAAIRGSIRFRLAFDPRGFDAIDDYDSREWLMLNGASRASANSAFIRGLYDLAFAYENGDPHRPMIAAGAALRGSMRAFFTYRGAFFWRMNAGMGDVVFAPLYEVLKRRGVRFEFFHKLTNVRLASGAEKHVTALDFDVQAKVAGGRAYRPLIDVNGLPSWPSQPDYRQLVGGDRIRAEGWDLEAQSDARRAGVRSLRVGEDFDVVVLGVALGVVPYTCQEILARDARWRDMVSHVKTVPTQAFQLWLKTPMAEQGWDRPALNLSGFVEPFDTWADMTHVAPREAWPEAPRAIAYFCNVLPDGEGSVAARYDEVRRNAVAFLNGDLRHIWPKAQRAPGVFDWQRLLSSERAVRGESMFDSQFWTANVRPSDRYSQALPGTTRFRISPLDPTYDNLTIAGDWTSSGLNTGCVESAVMSGLLAAHAIVQRPALSDIVGYDHP